MKAYLGTMDHEKVQQVRLQKLLLSNTAEYNEICVSKPLVHGPPVVLAIETNLSFNAFKIAACATRSKGKVCDLCRGYQALHSCVDWLRTHRSCALLILKSTCSFTPQQTWPSDNLGCGVLIPSETAFKHPTDQHVCASVQTGCRSSVRNAAASHERRQCRCR